jgi:colicin import membrane protein
VALERKSDRWISITQSVLLHAAVIGALAYGVYAYKKAPRPTPTLAIEGSIVESKDLKTTPPQVEAPPQPAPQPPPEPEPTAEPEPQDQGPPTPSPEELEQQKREAADALKKLDEDRLEQERKAAEQKVAEQKAAEQKATEQKAREETQRKQAEEKKLADAKKRAEEKRKADEERVSSERQAELRKSLDQEEHAAALRSSGALASWLGQIANRIQRNWLRPPSAKPGINCMVYVTQVPGGEVTNVRVGECNGDAAVRQSIESAVLRASPLPPPPDPSLFDRNLEIRFIPVE